MLFLEKALLENFITCKLRINNKIKRNTQVSIRVSETPKQQNKTSHTPVPTCEARYHRGVGECVDTVACINLLCVYVSYICDRENF